MLSWLVHTTVSPTFTFSAFGENMNVSITTGVPAAAGLVDAGLVAAALVEVSFLPDASFEVAPQAATTNEPATSAPTARTRGRRLAIGVNSSGVWLVYETARSGG